MWSEYICVTDVKEAIEILDKYQEKARIIAGATDLLLEIDRGVRKGINVLVDISRVNGLNEIQIDENGWIHLGPLVTHNDCVKSSLIQKYAMPLSQAAWEVGSPQIRNRGTITGNLVTASPANDTISPLMALGAKIRLVSSSTDRWISLKDFYTGVRSTVMRPDEMVMDISFPKMNPEDRGIFLKFALRRAQAISLVNLTIILSLSDEIVQNAKITLGAVAPTIIHAEEAENYLSGKPISQIPLNEFGDLVMKSGRPINDIRGAAAYRRKMIRVLAIRALERIRSKEAQIRIPENPVVLSTGNRIFDKESIKYQSPNPIRTTINGVQYDLRNGYKKSLLRLIREDAHLTGTKEGCAEGECGACTIFLDGAAVMSCMVPAARAHGAIIRTIEGLADSNGKLNPVQQAFVESGAVQCGYCIPGFIMSGTKLIEEIPLPDTNHIKQALTGNLCRCTGYYKIVEAIENAIKVSAG